MPVVTFTCKGCGKNATKNTKRKPVYCSLECYQFITASKVPFSICKYCGEKFRLAGKQAQNPSFCSRKCYNASIKQIQILTCKECGQIFTKTPKPRSRLLFCSQICEKIHNGELQKYCKRCGIPIKHSRQSVKKGIAKEYCSKACRLPASTVDCETCGKNFRVCPSEQSAKRFCTISCYRRFVGESSLEKDVREALERLQIEFIQEFKIGRYSVDFAIHSHKAVIEADGLYWHSNLDRDRRKTAFLEGRGWRVVRISDAEASKVFNLDALIASRLQIFER